MKKYGEYHWNSIVDVQDCYYSGGIIQGTLKPVVTIKDIYYTGSPRLENDESIFRDLKALIETLCSEVWNGQIQ